MSDLMKTIRVVTPGLLTTVQDKGRYGRQALGFTPSGAMDRRAMEEANILINNDVNAAVLEMTYMGGSFKFEADTYFAITGADMSPKLNGLFIANDKFYKASSGDYLEFGTAKEGKYTYLAVAKGFQVPTVQESRSTSIKLKLGGFEGRPLKAGDELPVYEVTDEMFNAYKKYMPHHEYAKEVSIRVVLGPQDARFTERGIRTFTESEYTISPESDRMGYRLTGEPIEAVSGMDILSDGIVFGSIQIPPKGTPIVMMADHQTTGGYTKIATVITPDLGKLSQCMPGAKVHFEIISKKDAEKAYKKYLKELKCYKWETGYHRWK